MSYALRIIHSLIDEAIVRPSTNKGEGIKW